MGSTSSTMDISETQPNGNSRELVTGIDLGQGRQYAISATVDVCKGQKILIGNTIYTHKPNHKTLYTRYNGVKLLDVSVETE